MRIKKKGQVGMLATLGILAILAIAVFSGLAYFGVHPGKLSVTNTNSTTNQALTCSGVSSVTETYQPVDAYQPSTTAANYLYILTNTIGAKVNGAITLPPGQSFSGVEAYNSTTYFAEPVSFSTLCSNDYLSAKLKTAGAPTITVTNDNGVTLNAAGSNQTLAASSSYSYNVNVKAPALQCGSVHGALLVLEYNSSAVNSLTVSGLGAPVANPQWNKHSSIGLANGDAFVAYKWDGSLCDGAKQDFTVTEKTSTATPATSTGNWRLDWIPLNYGVDSVTGAQIGPTAADSSNPNTALTLGNTTALVYTD